MYLVIEVMRITPLSLQVVSSLKIHPVTENRSLSVTTVSKPLFIFFLLSSLFLLSFSSMAEHANFVQPAIPKFDGFYDHWAMLMENLLRSKEYWSVIETGVVIAPPNATQEQRKLAEESKLRDLKVKNYMFQSIDRAIMETILTCDTAKDIWDAMRRKYHGSTKVKRAQLQALR
jgi:hypothetical protein